MDIKIKKKGKTKRFKLISSWEDVTLETWLKLIYFHKVTKSKEEEETIAALSTIPKDLINQLELKDVVFIMAKLSELQTNQDSALKRVIEIQGKRYGYHPNLDEITLGEYADLETMIKNNLEKNMPEVMAILYRPIVNEENDVYTIEAYDGKISIRAEEMKKMSAEQVQSALVFFWAFVNALLLSMESFLIQVQKEMKMQLPPTASQKSGVGSEFSTDSQQGK